MTGFDAAHDSGGSLTIDIIQDEDGNILENFTNDSVWNYHVWNEVRDVKLIPRLLDGIDF